MQKPIAFKFFLLEMIDEEKRPVHFCCCCCQNTREIVIYLNFAAADAIVCLIRKHRLVSEY